MKGISFIIPVWNRPDMLQYILDSLQAQLLVPQQIIIVDDTSSFAFAKKHKSIAIEHGCEYYYNHHLPKKWRRTECNNIGLKHAKYDMVVFSASDFIFEQDYTLRCYNLVCQYINMALSTINYNLPFPEVLQPLLDAGISLMDIMKLATTYNDIKREYDESPYLSYSCEPKPTREGYYYDSASWMWTENAVNKKAWDSDIYGWGNDQSDCINNLLIAGMSLCVVRDICTYHVQHHKDNAIECYDEGRKLFNEKWKDIKIPLFNELIRI